MLILGYYPLLFLLQRFGLRPPLRHLRSLQTPGLGASLALVALSALLLCLIALPAWFWGRRGRQLYGALFSLCCFLGTYLILANVFELAAGHGLRFYPGIVVSTAPAVAFLMLAWTVFMLAGAAAGAAWERRQERNGSLREIRGKALG
jgi:hypothetical protein